jgi:hypothetical protein
VTRNHIVSVDIVKVGSDRIVITTPDPLNLLVDDTVQWFSRDGPHEGKIVDGSPFREAQSWKGEKNGASDPLTAGTKGRFKYSIKVTESGQQTLVNDPEVIVT